MIASGWRVEREAVPMASLNEIADELYALLPADFIEARDAKARAEKAAGNRGLAAEIGGLRKPTGSAWMVNALARERPQQLEALGELASGLREAQHTLSGDDLRRLSVQRQQLVAALVSAARGLAKAAGIRAGADAEREVQQTLQAALADPEVAAEVALGHLAKPVEYAGFGVESPELVLVAPSRPAPADKPGRAARPAKQAPAPAKQADSARERKLAAAEQELADAERERLRLVDETPKLEQAREQAAARVDQLRAQLHDAERRLADASLELRASARSREAAERAVSKARALRDRLLRG
jgi:hypothetical protein